MHKNTCNCDKCFRQLLRNTNGFKKGMKRNKQEVKEASKLSYYEYLKSHYWLKRKQRYYLTHKKQCQACGSLKNINLHHTTYGDFGHEPDWALICLCKICHEEYHRLNGVKNNMITSSREYIKRKQALINRFIHLTKNTRN